MRVVIFKLARLRAQLQVTAASSVATVLQATMFLFKILYRKHLIDHQPHAVVLV